MTQKAGDATPSDFEFVNRDSDVLMISFGGHHEGFNFRGLADQKNFDGLFFRDSQLDWYVSGVRGVSERFADICEFIRRQISMKKYHRVFCIGQSSGGYAALRFAVEVNPDACLTFSPQTRPVPSDVDLGPLPEGVNRSSPDHRIDALGPIFRARMPSFRTQIHVCESEDNNPPETFFWDDWLHVSELREIDGVEVVAHPCSIHSAAYYLSGEGKLSDIVDSILE